MAITPALVTQSSTDNSSNTITVTKPSEVADGHLLIAGIQITDSPNDVSSPPSGWTDLFGKMDNGSQAFRAYWKIASGEGASWVWTFSNGNASQAQLLVIKDADGVAPINASGAQNNGSGTNIAAPSITTTVDDALLIGFFAKNNGNAITPDAAMTEILDTIRNTQKLESAYEVLGAAGSTGTRTASSTGSATSTGALIAIKGRKLGAMLHRYGGM